MIFTKFKGFLGKNLKDFWAFVDGIWNKLKMDSNYKIGWLT